jgi:hypothetical protein
MMHYGNAELLADPYAGNEHLKNKSDEAVQYAEKVGLIQGMALQ